MGNGGDTDMKVTTEGTTLGKDGKVEKTSGNEGLDCDCLISAAPDSCLPDSCLYVTLPLVNKVEYHRNRCRIDS